jgi:tetratricopeptide (TPR) repeat protein
LRWYHSDHAARLHDWLSLYFDLAADPRFARDRQRGAAANKHYSSLYWASFIRGEREPGQLVEKALQVDPEALLEGAPDLVRRIWSYVLTEFDKAFVMKAMPWLEKVLLLRDASDAVNAKDSEQTRIEMRIELATVYLLLDRPAEALPHVEKALQLSMKTYGETDTSTLASLLGLADTHLLLGHLDKSRSLYEKIVALDAHRPTSDAETGVPEPGFDLRGRSSFFLRGSTRPPAGPKYYSLYGRLCDLRANALGAAHPFYPINLDIMAQLLEWTDRKTEAKQRYEEALELRKKVLGPTHRDAL